MNIRLLLIRNSSPELHESDTCFLRELCFMERYVATTYRLHELHMCVQGGYVTTTYPKNEIVELIV